MHAGIELPKAFSVRDEHEFLPIQHLLARLNPQLSQGDRHGSAC